MSQKPLRGPNDYTAPQPEPKPLTVEEARANLVDEKEDVKEAKEAVKEALANE